jgi:outer membrane protein OmpA-like peptidoglycan-associated protein
VGTVERTPNHRIVRVSAPSGPLDPREDMPMSPSAARSVILSSLCLMAALVAAPAALANDASRPLISRFAGSTVVSEEVEEHDFYDLVIGYDAKTNELLTKRVDGKVSRSVYNNPRDRSILEIYQSYVRDLEEAGVETLFECAGDGCGPSYETGIWKETNGIVAFSGKGSRYLAGALERDGKQVFVAVMVGSSHSEVDVIESVAIATGLLAVNADALAADLATRGRATLHGIYFDSGNATLKPESKVALGEIAKFLRQRPDLRVYVVGHTDSVGAFDMNMKLSHNRASAVVSALVDDYSIDASRISAHGVGPLAPVASNGSREGRSKNRRVELVEH